MCFAFNRNILMFMFILYFGDLVWSVNNYGALLLVEFMMSSREPVSVVKLRVSLLMLWFGVLVLCMGKTETMSCHGSKGLKLIY